MPSPLKPDRQDTSGLLRSLRKHLSAQKNAAVLLPNISAVVSSTVLVARNLPRCYGRRCCRGVVAMALAAGAAVRRDDDLVINA